MKELGEYLKEKRKENGVGLEEAAEDLNKHLSIANIHSSDVFYKENDNFKQLYKDQGCMAVEMESFALFHNANVLGKRAACLLTVTDNLVTGERLSSDERQQGVNNMIEIALESILHYD